MSLRKHVFILFAWALSAGPMTAATFDVDDLQGPGAASQAPQTPFAIVGNEMAEADRLALTEAVRLFGTNQFTDAERIARGLTQTAPEQPGPWHLLGLVLANLNRFDEAVSALDTAAGLYKNNAEPLVVKGDILLATGQPEGAVAAWQAAADRDPDNWSAQDRLASVAEQRGDRAEAIRRYELSLKTADATRPFPRLQLARLALLDGRPQDVEPLIGALAKRQDAPDLAIDYLSRAMIGLDRLDEAETLLNRLVDRDTHARSYSALARIWLSKGKIAEAEALMAQASQSFPDNISIMLEHGRILGAVGKYEQAVTLFEAGLQKAPDARVLLNAASLAKARLGAFDEALELARRAAGTPDAQTADRMWLANLLEKTGAPADAEALYRKVIAAEPENWVALNNLAALLTLSKADEAVTLATRAAELAPDAAPVRDTLGWAQFKAGQTAEAEATFRAMRQSDPEAAQPAYRLGFVLIASGRQEEGVALLTEALEKDPKSNLAEEARKLIP